MYIVAFIAFWVGIYAGWQMAQEDMAILREENEQLKEEVKNASI